ncbi:hypothetical protein CTAYLR_009788 [Chrysophaeum taylorii]|uniref:DUF4168 domain-containing protein n=1 Tax=Chrysophaeum taylorii TaxID=2483200 RepID=A0AAD7UF00_9STRA|nr:hypothetical protein CTAYLR_009788 [Chrysophaeum taylorii]
MSVRWMVFLTAAQPAGAALSQTAAPASTRDKLSLFSERPEDALYDRYALALAATERSRELRDEALREAVGQWRWAWTRRFRRSNVCDPRCREIANNPRWRSACARHAVVSARVIDAVAGLSVAEFNQLSRVVAASPTLKKKVLHQAYLYRIASRIEDRRDGPEIHPPLEEIEPPRQPRAPDSMRAFASLAQKVEKLRQQQRAELIAALGIDEFPDYPVCDDRVLPFMAPEVREMCRSFPTQAADLVRSHGVDFDTFERLLSKADKDPFFRWRLARAMRQLEAQRQRYHKQQPPPLYS